MTWVGTPVPGGWQYDLEDSEARIILDYITPRGSSWEAWVECWNGEARPLVFDRADLSSLASLQRLTRALGDDKKWGVGLSQAFYETIEAERDSVATVDLANVEPKDIMFIVDPLLEAGGNTRLIAPGGSGKSLIADAFVLTVTTGSRKFLGLTPQVTGPVMILDWETNQDTHARRMKALCDAAGVPMPPPELILYRNETRPLWRSVQTVERAVRAAGVVAVVVDSRVPAAGPSGQSSGEEATVNLHGTLREIGPPALILDHKTKEDIQKNRKGGYGSIFNDNLSRMVWEFTKHSVRAIPDGKESAFVLELTKENNVGPLPPIAFHLLTTGGKQGIRRAEFVRVDPDSVAAPAVEDTAADRIFSLFTASNEPLTVAKISELTNQSISAVKSALNRDETRFENVAPPKKTGLWRLTEEGLGGLDDAGQQTGFDQLVPVDVDEEPDRIPPPDDVEVF